MADEKGKKIEDLKIGDLVIGDEKWGKVKQNSKTNEMYYAYRGGIRDGSIDAYVGLKIENLIEVSDFEKELAVEEPEKWNLVNDKKRQEFYNKIGIDPTEPLFAGGKSLQDITIEVNEPVYEPEDYNTPDRKLTLSADDVLADAFMSYEKYEEGMPFPGWYQYEKDIPLAEIKNIDDFLSEKNFAFNYDHNIDVRKIFNLARDSREAFLKEKENVKNLFSSLTGPYDPSTGEKFTGKNAEKALLVMQQRNSKDPRFLEYPAIDEYGLSLKDNLKEKLVLIEKGKERIFFNAIDINGIPPYKEKRIEIKKKQLSSQGYEL